MWICPKDLLILLATLNSIVTIISFVVVLIVMLSFVGLLSNMLLNILIYFNSNLLPYFSFAIMESHFLMHLLFGLTLLPYYQLPPLFDLQ